MVVKPPLEQRPTVRSVKPGTHWPTQNLIPVEFVSKLLNIAPYTKALDALIVSTGLNLFAKNASSCRKTVIKSIVKAPALTITAKAL